MAFKPNTDDMRDAPSRVLIQALLRAGASVHAHDPVATAEARRLLTLDFADAPECLARIRYADKPLDALHGADALVIMTEWKAYRSPNFTAMQAAMKAPVIFDGRNLFEPERMASAGFHYTGIGRNTL